MKKDISRKRKREREELMRRENERIDMCKRTAGTERERSIVGDTGGNKWGEEPRGEEGVGRKGETE